MKSFLAFLWIILWSTNLFSQDKTGMRQLIEQNFRLAAEQYKLLEKNTPAGRMPKAFYPDENRFESSDTKWWCSGFFPGTLWYIYEYTHDPVIKETAEKRLAIQEKEKNYTGNHDLGFMMYCSFGNAYRITRNPAYKEPILTAAGSLATRYRPVIKSIQSWNKSEKLNCPVIIDNMMNLELLCWASENGGEERFREIALNHSNSTLKHHFREDNSSYHVLDYDLTTGQILKKITWQGYADNSAWARGQSWGLYGFTMMYRFTKNKDYLDKARAIARFLLNHPNLPADKIPYWDYNDPNIPGTYRDASAGAVMASAFLELSRYVKKKERKQLVSAAETIIRSLSSAAYLSPPGENGGFLLKHSVGSLPHQSEVDVSLTYADYYFIEAMLRYRNWVLKKQR